ncbi:MAG: hypothetical protein AB1589_44935 [Cyanobacteriota bacterium]
MAVGLSGCDTVTTNQYEATAQTTLTWQVQYSINPVTDKHPRFEEFASNSLLNRNGLKPEGAVIGPDEKGLWWPALPPRPSIDQVEQRLKPQEQASKPELLRTVKYRINYNQDGQTVTLPTNYDVYRQVARAYPSQKPLRLTLGLNNASVTKAEPAD